jgi:hypothetical protein
MPRGGAENLDELRLLVGVVSAGLPLLLGNFSPIVLEFVLDPFPACIA